MANGIIETLKEHPVIIGLVAIGVVFLAIIQSRSSGTSGGVTVYGNTGPVPLDPNVAAISEATISAGHENISTIAQLINGMHATDAEESVSLASTEAARSTSLAQISAQQEVADTATQAGVTISAGNNAAAIAAANITAATQAAQITAAAKAAADQQRTEVQLAQFQKDIARAQDNTSIFGDVLSLGGKALAFFGL